MSDEIKIRFNTEEGQAVFTSDIIKGKLDSLIVFSTDKVSVIVQSKLGYDIFHTSEHLGVKYYAPRSVMQGVEQKLIVNDQFEKFNLNEELEFIITGPKNKDVVMILRFS